MRRAQFQPIEIDLSPAEVAAALAHREGFVFLDSSLETDGAISIIACDPETIVEGPSGEWDRIAAELEKYRCETGDRALPAGAAIGWVGFDGTFRFGIFPHLLIHLHRREQWLSVGNPPLPAEKPLDIPPPAPLSFRSETTAEEFCAMVRTAQDYIAAGDIYQVCLAHRFVSPWEGNPWPFYVALRHYSPAPHAAYLQFGSTHVLSASPESFLRMSGSHIATRPIKGTRPRWTDFDRDECSAYDLLTSPKEIAELVMITDLERNDLGRVCDYGSVRVSDLLHLERFEQVFHLVSTVEGHLRKDVSHLDALRACFPGGSISGAPKKRALEIIAELEPAPRGIYTGAIGFLGFNEESAFNIAIRTAVIEGNRASFHAGAGIVADSSPEKEWQETLDKASGILLAARQLGESAPARSAPPR